MIHSEGMAWVELKSGRERSLRRRHPWVLSGSVAAVHGAPEAGELVEVRTHEGEALGWGDWSPHSAIRVRMLSAGPEPDAKGAWLRERLERAIAQRRADPALGDTDAWRLVNAEGDGLPGLVVDRYAEVLVVRVSTAGMQRRLAPIAEALRACVEAPVAISRPDPVASRREGIEPAPGLLYGNAPVADIPIREGRREYRVDARAGQKTGFYLDGRLARAAIEERAEGARVLDLFCYTGGYAVAAARGGARSVVAVDSSAPALERARAHLAPYADRVATTVERADAFSFVRGDTGEYDLLVIDPPPLARRAGDVRRASRAYKDVLLHALRRAAPGAELVTFSCSHYVGPDLFRKIAFGASLDAQRPVQVLAELGAPSDHPVALDHPEGRYFTGLWLRA